MTRVPLMKPPPRSLGTATDDPPVIAVLLATAFGRTELVRERSLLSVYQQRGVAPARVRVVVVDDNEDPSEFDRVRLAVRSLRAQLRLPESDFPTTCLRNHRSRGQSGTGAWNTGLGLVTEDWADPALWIAFLDDDDEFLPDHLANCIGACADDAVGVFERLEWVRSGGVEPRPFSRDDLTPEAFFVGNPGVQGSNLFVRSDAIRAIGGFDESLSNTTDRDLMIRLLRLAHARGLEARALPSVGARYYDHDGPRVNTDLARKRVGLARFYAKYARDFSPAQLRASLERARRLFGYEPGP